MLLLGACTPGGSDTTTTAPETGSSSTDSTEPTPSTTTLPVSPTTVTGTASESLDPAVVQRMRKEVAELVALTEEIRGLPFLQIPAVAILDEEEFTANVATLIAEDLDEAETLIDDRFFTMMGMLDPDVDLYAFLIDLFSEQVLGYYDGDTKELVVPAAADGFTPAQRLTLVHELVHSLTDQHFEHNTEANHLRDEGTGDDASALSSLVEGDATYFQFVYLEGLPPAEALAIVTELLAADTSTVDAAPDWLQADLLFPYEQGLEFVGNQLADGGIAGVDRAYIDPPATTEQVLHPVKYDTREAPLPLQTPAVALDGWDVHDEGALGEWGLRLVLMGAISPGAVTQAAAGWGNDAYQIFSRGEDVAFVMHYAGDSEADAEDLANGLIVHARNRMATGSAVESGGGLLFDDEVYVFIDRIDDELFFVASTDGIAGAELRAQLGL